VFGDVLLGIIFLPEVEKVTGGWKKLYNEKLRGYLWGSGGKAPRILSLETRRR
jgi:hypothetical protein